MTMRITDATLTRTVLSDIEGVESRLSDTQAKMSSGKSITKPSDDPYGTGRALGLRADLAATQQYTSNAQDATSWTTVTDTALSGISDVVQRARELLVRASTGSLGATDRQAIAAEIDQLAEAAKESANATYDGRYVLAGTAVQTKPYATGSDAYAGDAGAIQPRDRPEHHGPGQPVRRRHPRQRDRGERRQAARRPADDQRAPAEHRAG